MSERTGLGCIETALVLALEEMGGGERTHRCSSLLAALDERLGVLPRFGYAVLVDLVQPWQTSLPVLMGSGNFGSSDADPPANARYTECRLSAVGKLAAAAERGDGPPIPIGLINGTMYGGGTRPPHSPRRITNSLLLIAENPGASDKEIIDAAGGPAFPTGCAVSGDLEGLAAGRRVRLRLVARMREGVEQGRPILDLTAFPPGVGTTTVANALSDRARRLAPEDLRDHPELAQLVYLPIRDVQDMTSMHTGTLVRCWLDDAVRPAQVKPEIENVWGVSIEVDAQLPASLPAMLRSWVSAHGTDSTIAGARRLQETLT